MLVQASDLALPKEPEYEHDDGAFGPPQISRLSRQAGTVSPGRNNDTRERRTGPRIALMVVRCVTYKRSFTVYPPGYRPYGRRRLAPVALDGSSLLAEPARESSGGEIVLDGDTPQTEPADEVGCDEIACASVRGFDGTVFAAALDAARGRLWPCSWQQPEPEGHSTFWYSTQARHTREASRLLGLTSETSADKRAVLAALPASGCLVDRLAEAGHVAGLWGEPWRWDPRHRVLRPRPFRPLGTRAPPCPT